MKKSILVFSFIFCVINPVFAQIGGLSITTERIDGLSRDDISAIDSVKKETHYRSIISEYFNSPNLENTKKLQDAFHSQKAKEVVNAIIQKRNEQLLETQNVVNEAKEKLKTIRKTNKNSKIAKQIEALILTLEAKLPKTNLLEDVDS